MSHDIHLLATCPDHKGLVAAVSSFVEKHNGNILRIDQYLKPAGNCFFLRIEIDRRGFGLARDELGPAFAPLARRHGMDWRVAYTDEPKRMAVMVSRYDHCLLDLLWRWEAGDLYARIPLVISNHPDLAPRAETHNIPFHHWAYPG